MPPGPQQRDRLPSSLLQAPGFLDYRLLGKQKRKPCPASFAVPAFLYALNKSEKGDLTASLSGTGAPTKLSRGCQEQVRSQKIPSAWEVAKS